MNFSIYKIAQIILLTMFFVGSLACHHDHSGHDHAGHNHGHTDTTTHNDHGEGKTVHLNEAQYLNAEIDTGWFELKNLSDVIHANGYTKLDPQDQAEVSMPVAGTIKSIEVIEGDYVKRGQVLGTLLSLEYEKIMLENKRLLLDKANLVLNKSELEEELSIAEANKVYLQKEYDRQQALVNDKVTAQKVFEKVNADLQVEVARIRSVKEQIALIEQTINSFGNGIQLGGGNSSMLSIVAPISGYVTAVNVIIGANADAGKAMFSIVDNSKMHVDLLVYEKDLARVKVGQTVRFILTNQSNQEIKGEIYNIGKSFASDTKSVAVHADIEKNDTNLIPGMYINALIDVKNTTVQTVPENAVVRAEGREFVFLWEKENMETPKQEDQQKEITFARLEVKTGARQLGYVQVTPLDEIHNGDKIVTQGAYYLQSHLQKAEGGGGHHH